MKLSALAAQIKNCGHCEVINNGGRIFVNNVLTLLRVRLNDEWTVIPEHRTRESWALCWAFRRRR